MQEKQEEFTLQVSLEAFRLEGCAGMSETGQTTNGKRELFKNKDERERAAQNAQPACLLLCHT